MRKRTPIPIHRLKKKEIIWLFTHRCKHGHRYLDHYPCYIAEHPEINEKIGFLDIECSNLDANWGIILSYCIKPRGGAGILKGLITKEDIKKYPHDQTDKRIVKDLIADMLKFDRLVAHYGRRFDLPYIRTRALIMGLDFPHFGSIQNDDTWVIARKKLKLNNNRLETIDRALNGESIKTHLTPKYWIAGARGDKKALAYILDHNEKDVVALEDIWLKLNKFVSKTNCSI